MSPIIEPALATERAAAPLTGDSTRNVAAPVWPAQASVLDLIACPLDGVNLIEASAGTGKTHTITRLFLRLLLEQNARIEEILIVTFTVAATEELRERLRALLQKTVHVLADPDPANVVHEDALLETLARSDARETYLERARAALANFDRAAIYTIHGFCHRVLREHAFESGVSFGLELCVDQSAYVEEMIHDRWRRWMYTAPAAFQEYALERGFSPGSLLEFYRRTAAHPHVEIYNPGAAPSPPPAELVVEFESLRASLAGAWATQRAELETFFDGGWLNRRTYTPGRVRAAFAEAERFLAGNFFAFPSECEIFRASVLGSRRTKIPGPPTPVFFQEFERLSDLAVRLWRSLDDEALSLERELAGCAREFLAEKKRVDETFSYDDLLSGLEQALTEEPALGERVRAGFRAALIDEFQDTDQVQWHILETLFRTGRHTLFLIGDPKQSIYSFRGADVFAYIEAKRAADRQYTLAANYRAVPRLTAAVNALFGRPDLRSGADYESPFLYDEIPFFPARSATRRDPLLIGERDAAGLVFELLSDATGERDFLPREAARQQATAMVVREIERLLAPGRARIGEDPVRAGDVAVLVRTNREAELVQRELRLAGKHAIIRSEKSLFHSREAEETARLLRAVDQPHSEAALRSALVTDLLGHDALALEAVFADQGRREERLRDFADYRALRSTRGFLVMFRELTRKEGILERLLTLPDGERRVANFLHLGELLYHESLAGPGRETAWLARRRAQPGSADEHLPRLESDERAIQIVTVHFSKGLEYPIVFCPFLWNNRLTTRDEPLLVPGHGSKRFQLVPAALRERAAAGEFNEILKEMEARAQRELLAEDVRLAYVALTRASHRCYLYWGAVNRTDSSALAFLLHAQAGQALPAPGAVSRKLTTERIARDLRDLAANADGSIIFGAEERARDDGPGLAPESGPAQQAGGQNWTPGGVREFTGRLRPGPVQSSFSSLTKTHTGGGGAFAREKPEHADQVPAPLASEADFGTPESGPDRGLRSIFAFPGGTRAGDFFHEILETVDFNEPTGIAPVVERILPKYAFGAEWTATVARAVQDVLSCTIRAGQEEIVLGTLPPGDRFAELDFFFPLPAPGPTGPRLAPGRSESEPFAILREQWPAVIPPGSMKGFIDLVFRHNGKMYLLDWKSSQLGDDPDCYHRSRLLPVMARSGYILQYYIYTLALHRFLAQRLPGYAYERDFGGVLYVFLRGVRPARGDEFGIFFDRPDQDEIRAFEQALATGP